MTDPVDSGLVPPPKLRLLGVKGDIKSDRKMGMEQSQGKGEKKIVKGQAKRRWRNLKAVKETRKDRKGSNKLCWIQPTRWCARSLAQNVIFRTKG